TAFGEVIRVGYNHVPPDTLHENNRPYGPAVDMLNRVLSEMGLTPDYRFMPLARLIRNTNANEIDCILRIGANPLLRIKPTVPFSSTIPGVLFLKEKAPTLTNAEHLRPLLIGTKIDMPLTKSMETIRERIHWIGGSKALENGIKVMLKGRI